MTTVQEIYETIDAFAPFASQESWDNSGLLAGAGTQPAEKILTTLDISQGVIAEAAAQGVQLIVSHHPVIFSPLKALPVQQFFKALRYRNLRAAEQENGTVPRDELVFEHTLG